MSRRIALTIAYDGTEYAGWQRQKNAVAVQEVLEETVEKLFHEQVGIIGSGRTDAGVHARGQVAAMTLMHEIPVDKLTMALNSRLPASIRVMNCKEVKETFHPRYDAKRKTYRYSLYEGQIMPPEYRNTAALVSMSISWEKVDEMLRLFIGEHDFAAFQTTGSSAKSTIREIYKAERVQSIEIPGMHYIEITGNGFLYNMVRIIVGTALEVGSGKRDIETVKKALETGERSYAGPTAPAQGLTLMHVDYPDSTIMQEE